MTDTTFAYHPPGLSPTRFSPAIPPPSSAPPHAHSPLFSHSRPSSSAGPYGLASLQEHPQDDENEGDDSGGNDRPRLVGFEQLTGETDSNGVLVDHTRSASGSYASTPGDTGRPMTTFRDPFQRQPSPGSHGINGLGQIASFSGPPSAFNPLSASAIAGPSQHAFFNPHPGVNVRNTRPMTAPSGPGYYHSSGYSAAPSAFYAPPQHASAAAGMFDPLTSVPPSFPYHLDPAGDPSYGKPRPPTADPSTHPIDPRSSFSSASADDGSPTNSTPFFYAPPPSSSLDPSGAIRTPSGTYYPASVLDSSIQTGHPASILPFPRPNTAESIDPSGSNRRRSSTGSGSKTYNFVQQAGQTTKRPRRRYDEIERLYNCDYPGCTKAYGTLNHLNSHKTMQKHGPKSTPGQFKEMRKAWRERKKAEAAAAARARASEPPNPSTLPTTTDPLGGPNGISHAQHLPTATSSDRPRPSTSAGEYHFNMPAPFVAPPSIGGPAAFHQPIPPSALHHPSYVDTTYATHYPSPLQPMYSDPYAARPVTAPSHFLPPAFGQPLSSTSSQGQTLPSPQAFHSPTFNLPNSSPRFNGISTSNAGSDRRFSLPAPTLHHQFASPEVQMPKPVLGYNPSALLNGGSVSGSVGGGGGMNGTNALGFQSGLPGANGAKLGMNGSAGASHGGAAEDGTFGAIKEDDEGEEHHPLSNDK